MKINRRETKDEAMTLMMVTMMTLMTMTLFKVTRESHVSSEFQTLSTEEVTGIDIFIN